jgi:hypothetical protein
MHRSRTIIAALAGLALTAGVATAHMMPVASDSGLSTASNASGQDVPMGHGFGPDFQPGSNPDTNTPPDGTHGATVSAAAQSPTPSDGGWANHGAYVSSIAKTWGAQTSAQYRDSDPTSDATGHAPSQAGTGLSHKP